MHKHQTSEFHATIASLYPTYPLEIQLKRFKNSARYYGSFLLSLRKPSKEPESSRAYVHGDPINLIDWQAFARTDQVIVRERREQASARVAIGFEVTETMSWPSANDFAGAVPTKLEIAIRAAFHLAHTHLKMGDHVSLWIVDPTMKGSFLLYSPRSPSDIVGHFARLLKEGFSQEAVSVSFRTGQLQAQQYDLSYWFGDALSTDHYRLFLKRSHMPFFFHTLSSKEVDTSWLTASDCYYDEGLRRKEYQGQTLLSRGSYLRSLRRWRKKIRHQLKNQHCNYQLITDKTTIAAYESLFRAL